MVTSLGPRPADSRLKQLKIIRWQQTGIMGTNVGHEFSVRIHVVDPAECELEWWERTDRPYDARMKPDEWCDMFALHRHSAVFQPWVNREGEKGDVQLQLVDIPGMPLATGSERRELLIEIRLKEKERYIPFQTRHPSERSYIGTTLQRRARLKQLIVGSPRRVALWIIENDAPGFAHNGPPRW